MSNKKLMVELLNEENKLHEKVSRQGYNIDWKEYEREINKINIKGKIIQCATNDFLKYGERTICIHDSFFKITENKVVNHYETKIKTFVLAYDKERNESSLKIELLIKSKTSLRFLNNREIYKFLIVPNDKIFAVTFFEDNKKKTSPVIAYLSFEIQSYEEVN